MGTKSTNRYGKYLIALGANAIVSAVVLLLYPYIYQVALIRLEASAVLQWQVAAWIIGYLITDFFWLFNFNWGDMWTLKTDTLQLVAFSALIVLIWTITAAFIYGVPYHPPKGGW